MDPEQARASFSLPTLTAARVARLLCGFTLALVACAVALSVPNRFDTWGLIFLADVAVAALVGGLISSRRPANPVGWFVAGYALCFALGEFTRQYAIYGVLTEPGSLPFARTFAWPPYWLWFPGLILLVSLLPLYFPNGRLLSPRWRPVVWLAVFAAAATAGIAAIQPSDHETPGVPNPLGIEDLPSFALAGPVLAAAWLGAGLASTASLVARFRRSRGEERQQVKWFAYAVVLVISYEIVNKLLALWVLAPAMSSIISTISGVCLWLAIAVAILKHNLYDIDVIINRTLVYGALTACVIGVYVLVVGYLGALFRVEDNLLVSLAATGIVAVLFAPLRERLQRGVNRMMYGERDDPYAVISRLGERMEATLEPDKVLATVAKTVREALKLPYAAISLRDKDGLSIAAEDGEPRGDEVRLPLSHRGEEVGEMALAPRPGEDGFSPSDHRLLEDLARQAGAAVHAVRLTDELQRSRERLVTAREEERRRLRRDLHDGLGTQLAAQTLKIGSARLLCPHDPAAADALMAELETDVEKAISDIRRLVYDLRPPDLDEMGLAGAIRESAATVSRTKGPHVKVEAPEELPGLPAAVEVAAYRIVREALTNVVRHAGAESCRVRLFLGDELEVEVTDDGAGIPEKRKAGVGLSSMKERAAELGGTCVVEPAPAGGTRVLARLPLPAEDDHER